MSVTGVAQSTFTYAYRISVYSVSISASQGATSAPAETTNTTPTPPVSSDQFRSDLATLFQAVKSGDMTAANAALQTVQADRPELFDSSLKATGGRAALQSDFQSLVSAVQAGDSTSAQGALTKLQSDVKAGRTHHHPHRRHPDGGSRPATRPAAGDQAASGVTAAPGAATASGDRDGDGDSH